MKEHMQYIIDHADEIEKLLKVKAQVSEVKSIMLENIDKAIERGENLTILNNKAEDLRDSESFCFSFSLFGFQFAMGLIAPTSMSSAHKWINFSSIVYTPKPPLKSLSSAEGSLHSFCKFVFENLQAVTKCLLYSS
ncbi:unnamed protein product [Ilex paraguariensis]|uniref:V-SNARE coiled-coil homology domain-containing protein n=1 Tax=Ilex paraguariensis TaxID=185542 RepID=A0ABC8R3J9_9AQUA